MDDESWRTLMREIGGREVFAWWPVPLHDRSGFFRQGCAWLRPVWRYRRIGWPTYFYSAARPTPSPEGPKTP